MVNNKSLVSIWSVNQVSDANLSLYGRRICRFKGIIIFGETDKVYVNQQDFVSDIQTPSRA
jgi:hypothetical protein